MVQYSFILVITFYPGLDAANSDIDTVLLYCLDITSIKYLPESHPFKRLHFKITSIVRFKMMIFQRRESTCKLDRQSYLSLWGRWKIRWCPTNTGLDDRGSGIHLRLFRISGMGILFSYCIIFIAIS